MTAPKQSPRPAELIDLLDLRDLTTDEQRRAELLILVKHMWPTASLVDAVRVVRYLRGGGWQ